MKTIHSIPFRILFLLLSFFAAAFSVKADVFGDYTYTATAGEVTITKYTGAGGVIAVPSTLNGLPVTAIGDSAFYSNRNLTTVAIPYGVTSIGNYAFEFCSKLTGVTIPGSVSSIGTQAFRASGLTTVVIPASVSSIGASAFSGCQSLTAFSVDVLNSTFSSVGGILFNKTQTSLIQYSGGKSGSYSVPSGVVSIESRAFSGCLKLANVTISDTVANIGIAAFDNCTSLSSIMVGVSNSAYSSLEGVLLNKTQTILLQFPSGKAGSYIIPPLVARIEFNAFNDAVNLIGITIPDSLTSIERSAFEGCTKLGSITVGLGNPSFSTIDGVLFDKSQATLIQCPALKSGAFVIPSTVTYIGDSAFYECTRLTSIIIPNSVTKIGWSSFEGCEGLTNIIIPGGVTSISVLAFSRCYNLISVTIPASVYSIGTMAFGYCDSLTSITISGNLSHIGDYLFTGCDNLARVVFKGNAPTLSPNAFSNDSNATIYYLPGTTGWGATFAGRPTSATSILGDFSYFATSTAVTVTGYIGSGGNVTVPGTINGLPVTAIADNAFDSSWNLTSVTISPGVTTIGSYAFSRCSLVCATIPSSVTNIGSGAFYKCSGLTGVLFLGNPPAGDSSVFSVAGDATIYYFPGTSAWGAMYAGRPATALAAPEITGQPLNAAVAPGSSVSFHARAAGEFCSYQWQKNGVAVTGANGQLLTLNQIKTADAGVYTMVASNLAGSVTSNAALLEVIDFTFTTTDDGVTITRYIGSGAAVTIPKTILGLPVTRIGDFAFYYKTSLVSVTVPSGITSIGTYAFFDCPNLVRITIPGSVISIGDYAFYGCPSLTSVYFKGSAPLAGSSVFSYIPNVTNYYLPGTFGWGVTFAGAPTALFDLTKYALAAGGSNLPSGTFTDGLLSFTKGEDAIANRDVSYVIEESTGLGDWSPVVTHNSQDDTPPTISYTLPVGRPAVFVRLKLSRP